MITKVEEEDLFSRERTPTEIRVFGALTYHAGASYRKAAALFDVSHEAVRQWFLQIEPLFQPRRRVRPAVAVDETKVNVDGRYDWPLETLGCRFRKETWGTRSLIESLFFVIKYRLWRFWKRFPYRSSVESTRRWSQAFAAIHNVAILS